MKNRLSFSQIINMNIGFFGLQYSFGLQQANMSSIYSYLGAEESQLPLLWLAGPVTGMLVQPIIGALSDSTTSRYGRRTPYFFIGAVICSLCLIAMPYSQALWMAASLLWILDAANNVSLEPYRAYVSDKLPEAQLSKGFLVQSAFTGLGQTLAYLTPTLLIFFGINKGDVVGNNIPLTTYMAFFIGAFFSTATILWTVFTSKEDPMTPAEVRDVQAQNRGISHVFKDIFSALKTMPPVMKQMMPMMLLSWYAMFTYWVFIARGLSQSLYGSSDPMSPGFREAELLVGQIGAFYNFIAFASAFALIPLARRFGARNLHGLCLACGGLAILAIPQISQVQWLFVAMLGLGISWASMMGNTYAILASALPQGKTGIFMGIFNLFIVIPMMIQSLTMPLIYEPLLAGYAPNAISLAGVLLLFAGASVVFIRGDRQSQSVLAKDAR